MKKSEVQVGAEHVAKVSGKLTHIRITGVNPHGGWNAVNVDTKRDVHIRGAHRLRRRVGPKVKPPVTSAEVQASKTAAAGGGSTASGLAKDKLSDGVKRDLAAIDQKLATPDPKLDADVEAAKKARAEKKAKAAKPKGERRPSLLSLAAEVLAEAKTPMDCKSIVEKVLAKGTWKTSGKTPAATLYSAIIREIGKLGDKARFRKTDRGQFEAVAAGKTSDP